MEDCLLCDLPSCSTENSVCDVCFNEMNKSIDLKNIGVYSYKKEQYGNWIAEANVKSFDHTGQINALFGLVDELRLKASAIEKIALRLINNDGGE